jgi:hypothetical protein
VNYDTGQPTALTDAFKTINPFQVGASLYPFVSLSHFRYDLNSVLIANTVGAKNILAGVPAQDTNVTWVNTYILGADAGGQVTVYGVSPVGNWGALFAARSSDNPSGSVQNVIGLNSLVVHDSTGTGHNTWSTYMAGYIASGSTNSHHINLECSVFNNGGVATEDPFNVNPLGSAVIIRLDNSASGGLGGNSISAAMDIVNNGAQCISGIVFGSNSLDTSVNPTPPALALPTGYATKWYSAAATVAGLIYEDSFTLASGANHQLGLGAGMLVVHAIEDGAVAIYLCAGASVTLGTVQGAVWVASTTTPGANQMSVAFNGTAYTVYSNRGASRTVTVAYIFTKPTP